jgi:uncharacterized membrane protein YfcA
VWLYSILPNLKLYSGNAKGLTLQQTVHERIPTLMTILSFLSDYSIGTIVSLIILCFTAGFIDAVIGGGGLIQLPAMLINFPSTPLPVIFGTNKIASLAGTGTAALQYARKIKFDYKILLTIAAFAAAASFAGARVVSHINVQALKPAILVILIVIAVYTFFKKDLGKVRVHHISRPQQIARGCVMGLVVGFYDGFYGPGTGSFLVLGFVMLLGFEFVEASAYSKVVNCMTNLGALFVFISQGKYMLQVAILMAVCNVAGNFIGSRIALKKGNEFVRIFFLLIVMLMITRYGYDIYSGK